MNNYLIPFLILSGIPILAEEDIRPLLYVFPSFEKVDIASPVTALSDNPSYEEMNAMSLVDLRSIMTFGNISDQDLAAVELIKRNDQKTILRLVYSLKEGNEVAENILRSHYSLSVLPYLMEDVAHGSNERYEKWPRGGDTVITGRVRSVATEVVGGALANAPEIMGPTSDCLRAISRWSDTGIESLSEKSRYLVQWWLLNESSLDAENWADTQPLPQPIRDPFRSTPFPWNPSNNPEAESGQQFHILGPSWKLSESFDAWSKRIVHPDQRNLDFVELTWNGHQVIQHPPKSLDPKRQSVSRKGRESRKALATTVTAEPTGNGGRIRWLEWCGVLAIAAGLVVWVRSRQPGPGV